MSAEEVLSQHLRSEHWNARHDGWVECMCGEPYTAAHQLDALKAAGYTVVDRSCPHDSWSGDGTGRWRCDECGADQGSQDVGEVRRQLVDSHTEVERLRHELSDAAARIRAFAKDNVFHGDMTPMAQRQWEKLADTIAGSETTP